MANLKKRKVKYYFYNKEKFYLFEELTGNSIYQYDGLKLEFKEGNTSFYIWGIKESKVTLIEGYSLNRNFNYSKLCNLLNCANRVEEKEIKESLFQCRYGKCSKCSRVESVFDCEAIYSDFIFCSFCTLKGTSKCRECNQLEDN
ncbi:MAG: hypothetical protein MR520_00230 [Mollicutes bacterium]|nr:hypothetical protein [Mollicutes bacterium]